MFFSGDMDQSSGRLAKERSLMANEKHKDGLPTDFPDKAFLTNATGESVIVGTLHSGVSRPETLPEKLVDSENKVHMVGHRSSACGSCRSSNDVDR